MENVSLLWTLAGLTALTFDTLHTLEYVRDSPAIFDDIRQQLDFISGVLIDTQKLIVESSRSARNAPVPYTVKECRRMFKVVSRVKRCVTCYTQHDVGSSRLTWSLAEEFHERKGLKIKKELDESHQELSSFASLLSRDHAGHLSNISASTERGNALIPAAATQVNSSREERLRVLQWLSKDDHYKRHDELQRLRTPGTGQRFLKNAFHDWRSSDATGVCWIRGRPGTGKTVLASLAVDILCEECLETRSQVAYAYCDSRLRSTFTEIVASLVRQLVAADRYVPISAVWCYNDNAGRGDPSLLDLMRLFSDTVQNYRDVFLVIDGFDEIEELLPIERMVLARIVQHPTIRLLVFSRNNDPLHSFEELSSHEVARVDLTIDAYDLKLVLESMIESRSFQGDSTEVVSLIGRLVENEKPSFVPYILNLQEILTRSRNIKKFEQELRRFVQYPDSMIHSLVTSTMIKRMSENDDMELVKLAMHTLTWVYYARRPLTTLEIGEAYIIHMSSSKLSINEVPTAQFVVGSCGGLVNMDSANTVIFTNPEVPIKLRDTFDADPDKYAAAVCRDCLRYLTLTTAKQDDEHSEELNYRPFLAYAEANWMFHLQSAQESPWWEQSSLKPEILQLTYQVIADRQRSDFSSSRLSARAMTAPLNACVGLSPLHIFARCKMLREVQDLLRKRELFEFISWWQTTPIHEAARNGSCEILDAFFDFERAEPHDSDAYERFDLWQSDREKRTPLHYAAYYGNSSAVQYMLRTLSITSDIGVINARDSDGKTALMLAAQLGHVEVVTRMLDAPSTDLRKEDHTGYTAAHHAAENGHYGIVAMLIDRDPTLINSEQDARPLLHCAVSGRSPRLVRLLLSRGAYVSSRSSIGQTALHVAAQMAETLIISRLLAQGAEIDCADQGNVTPLIEAVRSRNNECVTMLINYGADINHQSMDLRKDHSRDLVSSHFSHSLPNALTLACRDGSEDIVKTLLSYGADINYQDESGLTPLSYAIRSGHVKVVRDLLESGANLEHRDAHGRTPIFDAVESGDLQLTQILLDKQVDVDVRSFDRCIPISIAEDHGMHRLVSLLKRYSDSAMQQIHIANAANIQLGTILGGSKIHIENASNVVFGSVHHTRVHIENTTNVVFSDNRTGPQRRLRDFEDKAILTPAQDLDSYVEDSYEVVESAEIEAHNQNN